MFLGIDLGGTKVATGLVDARGRVSCEARRMVDAGAGRETVVRHVIESAADTMGQSRRTPEGVGVGVAGQVDARTGAVLYAPNLRWKNFSLRRRLESKLRTPVAVANDVQAVAWGEWLHGAGVGSEDLVCVFVGTGIGGGVVSGGRMLRGAVGAAGEVGHIPVVVGGRKCHCPNSGCLEAYAGGWGITERAREAIASDPSAGAPLLRAAGGDSGLSPAPVIELARSGDPLARRLFEETSTYLSEGMVGIVNAFNPSRLILGGGVLDGWPELLPKVAAALRSECQPPAARSVRVMKARLGREAGVVGSAAMARATMGSKGSRS